MNKKRIYWIVGLIILLNSMLVWSETLNIVVEGLFSDKAVLKINEKQRILTVGTVSPEGVKLISANSTGAIIEVKGVQNKYQLGSHIGGHYAPAVERPIVSIWPVDGMYLTTGSINGYSVDFLVDTGASAIALNAATANRLGITYLKAPVAMIKTASGIAKAYQVNLDLVQLGDIKLHNIQALVLDGPEPERALLGMTFLGQLEIMQKEQRMDLKKKY